MRQGDAFAVAHAHITSNSAQLSFQHRHLSRSWRRSMSVCLPGGDSTIRAAATRTALHQLRIGSSSARQRSSPNRLKPLRAAAIGSSAEEAASTDAAGELPLWRFLRQQGFSADGINRMQAAVRSGKTKTNITTGQKFTAQKLQRDLAPNIAALQAEGLDTATIELMFQQFPGLLTSTHATFSSSLAALRQLALLLPDDPRAVQAPPGATQLGVALWLYPTAAAQLLARVNLASLIDGNLRVRRHSGISDAQTAAGLLKDRTVLVSNFGRAEAMVAHLQHLQASGELSEEQGEQRRQHCMRMFALRIQSWFGTHVGACPQQS